MFQKGITSETVTQIGASSRRRRVAMRDQILKGLECYNTSSIHPRK